MLGGDCWARGGAEWGFGQEIQGLLVCLKVCLGAERARAGGGDCMLGGNCWARGGAEWGFG